MVTEHGITGIYLSKVVCIIDAETIIIQKNTEYAIQCQEESSKKLIHFFF